MVKFISEQRKYYNFKTKVRGLGSIKAPQRPKTKVENNGWLVKDIATITKG